MKELVYRKTTIYRQEGDRLVSVEVMTRLEDYVPGGLAGFRELHREDRRWWVEKLHEIHDQRVRLERLPEPRRERARGILGDGDKCPDEGRDPAEMIAAAIDQACA